MILVVRESTPLLFYLLMGAACALVISLGVLGAYVGRTKIESQEVDQWGQEPEVDYKEEEFPRNG